MRLGMVCAATLGLLALTAGAARADSYTWGYTYTRDRLTPAPVAAEGPPSGTSGAAPFVVPLPGQSQSTPVVVDGVWYLWTYWDDGRAGALWTGRLQPDGTSGPGSALTLPGAGGPVLTAARGGGERFDEPSDAAVSPDGSWVAFSAGERLYWWPAGDPAAGGSATITGPGHLAANSTSPSFVPDAASASGWDVCDGNWDGGFACFAARGDDPLELPTPGVYQVDWTSRQDADGYTAITSSAAYGGPLEDLYFGVASATDPRVMALDPRSGAYLALGGGLVRAPIWSAVALAGTDVYATDVDGTPYRFSAATGELLADRPMASTGVDIAAPALDAGSLYILVLSTHEILRLDRRTLQLQSEAPVGRAATAQASALTAAEDAAAPPELFFAAEDGGVSVEVPGSAPADAAPGTMLRLGGWSGPAAGAAYSFTAAVVDGDDVLLWSDGAAAAWGGAARAAPPPGSGSPAGGLQIYRLQPRLTAFVTPDPAVVGQTPALLTVLAPLGAQVVATLDGAPALDLTPARSAAPACGSDVPGASSPGFGIFAASGPASVGPAAGCGPFSDQAAPLTAMAQAAAQAQQPSFAGLAPADWQAAGAGYSALQASLPAAQRAGALPVTVEAIMPDGNASRETVWLTSACPPGAAAAVGGACSVDAEAAPDPWALVPGGAPSGDRCSPDVVPGREGWTQQEFDLLCEPPAAWLADPALVACYGSWWNVVQRQPLNPGCGPGHGA